MIKRARCRLKQLKNKRQVIARQIRKDVVELMQNDYEETAIKRRVIQDERLVAAYELLDQFFVFILEKLSYIRRHKKCPPDISEAVSSLIFASARCGDFPELRVIRKLFGQRYGEDFAIAAVELFPGNLVNKKLIENLSVMSLPDDQKCIVADEIARDNCLHPEVKEHEGNQLVESDGQINQTIAESKKNPSEVEEIERDAACLNSSISKPSDTFSVPEYTLTETSALGPSVQPYLPCLTYHPLQNEVEKEDFSDLQNKGEIMALVSSSERVSLVPYAEAMVEYYVDEIEESHSFVSKNSYYQDQRLSLSCDDGDIDQEESRSERSSIRGFRKGEGAAKKRLRRRSSLLESQGIIEIGCIIYYQKPCKGPFTRKHGTKYNKMGKKPLVEGIPQSNYPHKDGTQSCQSQGNTNRKALNLDLCDCNLDQPCYCGVYYDHECCQDFSIETKKGVKSTQNQQVVLLGESCHCLPLSQDESNKGVASCHLLTYPDFHLSKPNNETKADTCKSLGRYSSTNVSNPRTCSSLTRSETLPPNSRALTLTPEWPKNYKDNLLRTYSCTSQQPKHVHPKLPEYEDIVAIFTAFKRERECMARLEDK
ncbi:hypothetical protein CR513_55817, partial [Mucuna pruriens]